MREVFNQINSLCQKYRQAFNSHLKTFPQAVTVRGEVKPDYTHACLYGPNKESRCQALSAEEFQERADTLLHQIYENYGLANTCQQGIIYHLSQDLEDLEMAHRVYAQLVKAVFARFGTRIDPVTGQAMLAIDIIENGHPDRLLQQHRRELVAFVATYLEGVEKHQVKVLSTQVAQALGEEFLQMCLYQQQSVRLQKWIPVYENLAETRQKTMPKLQEIAFQLYKSGLHNSLELFGEADQALIKLALKLFPSVSVEQRKDHGR